MFWAIMTIVGLALGSAALAVSVVAVRATCLQTRQTRRVASATYYALDGIISHVNPRDPILVHDVGLPPLADTSVDPRFVRSGEKVALRFRWIDISDDPRFQPGDDDTVACAVGGPDGASYHRTFHGGQIDEVEYIFPDDFDGARRMKEGPYDVLWKDLSVHPDSCYGYARFWVVPL